MGPTGRRWSVPRRQCAHCRASVIRAKRRKAENKAAIESSNSYVVRHGLPPDTYRQF
ncbi:type II toxin-antitoxin system CcdA family antitoxin [uncultured Ruegeria sp.]|uniref:type II toxin-antitoxin system CcdA family antitoxin n=1 Tax=uncultured Ruegeria sp. TaxID=259304 RepID=UPI00345BE30C